MKILITGVGGPTPRSFAISLKRYSRYSDFEFIATDVNPLSIGLYQKELFEKSYIVPSADDANYWDKIEEIIEINEIELAIILPELEVMEWSKKQGKGELPCKVLLPDYSMSELLIDKAKMTSLLKNIDVVPKSIEFNRGETDLCKISNYLGFPYWVRSTLGTSGMGSLKIEDDNSLKEWIHINPNVTKFLASKFLSGRNLACKMLYHEGKLLRAAIGERVNYIMSKVAPSGITGNTSFGRFLNEPAIFDEAKKAMDYMFDYTGAKKHGFFTVDFKEDESGKPYITEVNIRHVAFTLCFAAAGANFAEDTIRLLDGDLDFEREFKNYEFEEGTVFLRDVDCLPILMNESELLNSM